MTQSKVNAPGFKNTRPYKVREYIHAERLAKQLLGPTGAVRFDKSRKKFKYMVGQAFEYEGKRVFGILGEGASWDDALNEAADRVAGAMEQ